jgi:molybdopterin synthase catalytic subunit
VVALAAVREQPLSVDECLDAVRLAGVGGTAVFVGTVRDHDHGRAVVKLEYTAHPRAQVEIVRVAGEAAALAGVLAVAAVHRVGSLSVGELAIVVAAGAAHRFEAFAACRRLVDDVKDQVPIWKRQVFEDGSTEWVGGH